MPGRKATHSAPVPWHVVVRAAGSVERLCDGVPEKTWGGWQRTREVPAYRALPFLLERFLEAEGAGAGIASLRNHPPQTDRSIGDVMADPEGREAFLRLSTLFKNKANDRESWNLAVELLKRLTPTRVKKTRDDKKARRSAAQ